MDDENIPRHPFHRFVIPFPCDGNAGPYIASIACIGRDRTMSSRPFKISALLNGISHPASFPPSACSSLHRNTGHDPIPRGRGARVWVWLRWRVNFTRHYPDADFFVLSGQGHDVKAVGRPFQYGRRTCRSTVGISHGTCAKTSDAMRYIATRVTDELLAHSSYY